jgi:ribonuclease M5
MIKEIIVVEGKDDAAAVKKAVDAEIITTHGYGISKQTYKRIETAYKTKGIIIFTDPDYAGSNIRRKLTEKFPECKHAYLSQNEARKGENIGIENADEESIIRALRKAKGAEGRKRTEFTMEDLYKWLLVGNKNAAQNREKLGNMLGIGYGNAKTFLSRLNNYDINREEFEKAAKKI